MATNGNFNSRFPSTPVQMPVEAPGYGERDRQSERERKYRKSLEGVLRELASRVKGLEDALRESGVGVIQLRAAEEGIQPGHLISHVLEGGAYLATASDITKPATAVCISTAGSIVNAALLTTTRLFMSPEEGSAPDKPFVYLAISPGYATFDGDESGKLLHQMVGKALEGRQDSGRCLTYVDIGDPREL